MIENPQQAARRLATEAIRGAFQADALHCYTDENGTPVFYRMRAHLPDGSKWIRPMHQNGNGWELGEPNFSEGKPLYRLHDIKRDLGAPLWFVEGEKCADALGDVGIIATTSGSATSDDRADFAPLADRTVTIWPDNDRPGIEHAERVAAKLQALGCNVEVIDAAALNLPEHGDCADWLASHPQAKAADLAKLPRVRTATAAAANAARDSIGVELLCGTHITPEPVRWLWPDYLAQGCLHIAAGAPGTGKSTAMLGLAAIISRGARWPDGSRLEQARDVVIWSGEDDANRTLLPRYLAMGGDPARIWFIGSVDAKDRRRPFDPATDMAELHAALAGRDIGFLGVDPVVSAVLGDGHHNADVRRSLQPLVDLAEALDCVVFGISHFSKGTAGRDPVERVTGSVAFGALARLVFAVAKDQAEGADGRRLFVRAKSNLGPDGGGFAFRLEQRQVPDYPDINASCVVWTDAVEGAARDLLSTAEVSDDPEERDALADAVEFLHGLLADGPVPAKQIRADADGAGHHWATVRRAQKMLKVEAVKEGGRFGDKKQQWTWRLPPQKVLTEDAHLKNVSAFCETRTSKGFNHADFAEDAQGSGIEHLQANDEHLLNEAGSDNSEAWGTTI